LWWISANIIITGAKEDGTEIISEIYLLLAWLKNDSNRDLHFSWRLYNMKNYYCRKPAKCFEKEIKTKLKPDYKHLKTRCILAAEIIVRTL
jgi:hypothetical protein